MHFENDSPFTLNSSSPMCLKRKKADIKPHLWLTHTVQLQDRQTLTVPAGWLDAVPWEEYL